MKKSIKNVIAIAGITIVALTFLLSGIPAKAGESSISTNGDIDFEGGTAGIYVDDFNYLQGEIDALFNEIN